MYIDAMLEQFRDSLGWLEQALAGVPDERAAEQPHGVRNHPAWTMTHLCVALDFTASLLGLPTRCPEQWGRIARPGSVPINDRAAYPSLAETTRLLRALHADVTDAVRKADASTFTQPAPEAIRGFAPTLGHIVSYMLLAHENYHLAQLAIWKQLAGLGKSTT